MTGEELSRMLKAQAVGLGLCKEWTEGWGMPGQQELIDKFLHGIDFCIQHNWPSVEFIKGNFDKSVLHKNKIFAEECVHLRNESGMVVLNGKCTGMVLAGGLTVCDLYVRHDSDVTVDCNGLSKVFVNVYDRARVRVKQSGGASVYVYLHGDDCVAETDGDVMIREKEYKKTS